MFCAAVDRNLTTDVNCSQQWQRDEEGDKLLVTQQLTKLYDFTRESGEFLKRFPLQNLNYLGLLVNSAFVRDKLFCSLC